MNAHPVSWSTSRGWDFPTTLPADVSLVLCFGDRLRWEAAPAIIEELTARFPRAVTVFCSTAGEILGTSVGEGGACAVAVQFESTEVRAECADVSDASESEAVGRSLGQALASTTLRHVLVLSDGLCINGTQLARGLRASLPAGVGTTGGLAGDGARFERTLVGLGRRVAPHRVVAIGFYGDAFRVGYGSAGGWQAFGPKRLVTKSVGNVLYELDQQPALALYKRYLGERAAGLPATGLLFPLELLSATEGESSLVRTILAVDEQTQSLTFAGDIPEGHFTRLMRASCDALVVGAAGAADPVGASDIEGQRVALLVSCVGRRLLLGQRIEEEVEAVLAKLGEQPVVAAGFYSYGELCPSGFVKDCELHNQTMTLTVFGEARR